MKSFHKLILALLTVALCFVVACGKTAKKTRLNRGTGPTDYSKTQMGPQNQQGVQPGSKQDLGKTSAPDSNQPEANQDKSVTKMETDAGAFEIKDDGTISPAQKTLDTKNQLPDAAVYESVAILGGDQHKKRLVVGFLSQSLKAEEICGTDLNGKIKAKLEIPFEVTAIDAAKPEEKKVELLGEEMSVYVNRDLIENRTATSAQQLKRLDGLVEKKVQLAENYDLSNPENIKNIKGNYNATAVQSGSTTELKGTFDAIVCN